MVQERQLVQKIARALASHPATSSRRKMSSRLKIGIGDDAALLSPAGRTDWVLSCDTFLENVHFQLNTHRPDSVGYKALARATSDLAAMGATPRFFLLTLALPATRTGAWLDAFLKGMARAARELRITVIGGDTTKSRTVFVSITVLGEIAPNRALTRSGARPGDIIYVSGKLGRAQLGLELVLRGHARNRQLRAQVQPHLYPKIRIELGSWLARTTHRHIRHGSFRRPLDRPGPPLRRQPSRCENLRQQNSHGSDPRNSRAQIRPAQARSPAAGVTRRRRLRTPLHHPTPPSKKNPRSTRRFSNNCDRRNHPQPRTNPRRAGWKSYAAETSRLGSIPVNGERQASARN